MAKMRGVKPDYWTDEDIVDLSIPARLLFIGLWNYACDNGHLPDKPKQIKMRLLPGDDVNAAELLRELAGKDRIERADGFIIIPKFAHHQKPNKRFWLTCDKPGCARPDADSEPETPNAQGGPSLHKRAQAGASADVDVDGDVDGEVMVKVKDARKRATTRLADDWQPTEKHRERRRDGIDIDREAEKFRLHAEANDRRMVNWNAAFSQWLLNARPSLAVVPPVIDDPALLPPVEQSWMRRRPQ